MKKISFILIVLLVFAFSGCGAEKEMSESRLVSQILEGKTTSTQSSQSTPAPNPTTEPEEKKASEAAPTSSEIEAASSQKPKVAVSEDSSKNIALMTAAKATVEKFYSNVKYSNDIDDWIFVDTDGMTNVVTKVTLPENSEKIAINIVITMDDNNKKYSVHYAEFGNEVLVDDGTVE